ncbi:MAG: hypothetical protein IJ422_10260 [Oscillospiraceae bacterium]|nr:hypothetical protein [Oscillospiraceae bacterium]
MSCTPKMITTTPPAFDCAAFEKNIPLWTALGKYWRKFDRVYSNEAQIVSLVETMETTEYLSSNTLIHPSIPEFVAICKEDTPGVDTYICYRKTLLTENDILVDETNGVSRRMIPVIDAYVYLNNGGTLCNYVVTLCKCILEYEGRSLTSTSQFITYIHDDPLSHSYADYDPQYVFEFNRTIKMLYLAVQMVSLERPEIICYGRTPAQERSEGNGKKGGRKKPVRMVKTIRFPACTAALLSESAKRTPVKMNCPCWGVAGHWRTYKKSGKKVWIEPYRKGKLRNSPAAYQPKEYEITERFMEVVE